MSIRHRETKIQLKVDGDIFASIGAITNPEDGTIQWHTRPELEVQVHHMAGMTISLDRNEALELLAFLKHHEQALLDANDPEAL